MPIWFWEHSRRSRRGLAHWACRTDPARLMPPRRYVPKRSSLRQTLSACVMPFQRLGNNRSAARPDSIANGNPQASHAAKSEVNAKAPNGTINATLQSSRFPALGSSGRSLLFRSNSAAARQCIRVFWPKCLGRNGSGPNRGNIWRLPASIHKLNAQNRPPH